MKIMYLDEHMVVCEKPVGTLSEGTGDKALPTLISKALLDRGENNTKVFTVHRLDKETVGVCVYARMSSAAAALSESIVQGTFKKRYLAVVCGTPERSADTLSDLLYYDRQRGKSFVVHRKRNGVRSASLDYELIATEKSLSLISVTLHTGRTHQIRVQFASRGLPLVGDRRYGAPKGEAQTVALCSCELSFPHPKSGEPMTFSTKPPAIAPWNFFEQTT